LGLSLVAAQDYKYLFTSDTFTTQILGRRRGANNWYGLKNLSNVMQVINAPLISLTMRRKLFIFIAEVNIDVADFRPSMLLLSRAIEVNCHHCPTASWPLINRDRVP
jgi:hypothetical protein